jgi:hypothetical protein
MLSKHRLKSRKHLLKSGGRFVKKGAGDPGVEEAMKQYISHFSVDRQGNIKKDKDVVINIPTLKVQSDAPPEANQILQI